MKTLIVTLLITLGASVPVVRGEPLAPAQLDAIDSLLTETHARGKLPALITLVDRGGETLYAGALGHANLSHRVAATTDTAFAIGSITKTFTGLAIAQLIDQGRLSLDDTVQDLLPGYDGPGRVATVAQLLTHSSGIPSYNTEIPGISEALQRNAYTRDELVGLFKDLPLNFKPGDLFSYSNSGYYLLGLIVEAVTATDYYSYLRAEVFEPLGMERSYAGDLSMIIPDMARGYDLIGDQYSHAPIWHQLVPFAAGSLVSTARDIVDYRRAVFRSDAISDAVRHTLLSTTTLSGGQENRYSLGGLVLSTFHGHDKVSHAGDIWGYASNHAYYPAEDLTIVMLANRQMSNPALSSVEAKVAKIVLGIPQPDIRRLKLSESELTRYTGEYEVYPFLIGFERLGFSAAEGGQLLMHFGGLEAGGPGIPLLAQGDGVFRAPFDDEWVLRFSQEGARAARIVSNYRDGTITARRAD